jgi:hypothetical protein
VVVTSARHSSRSCGERGRFVAAATPHLGYRPSVTAKDEHPVERVEDLTEEEGAVLLKVVEVLRRIEFGTILLVVQNGKVVQIEMAEKFRLR